MPAEVKKIRDDIQSDPQMIVGMLQGYVSQISHIAAVVIWDDGTFQVVNDPMPLRDFAYAATILQRELNHQMDE